MATTRFGTMNYREQERFFQGSRTWGGAVCVVFLAAAVLVWLTVGGRWSAGENVVFALTAVAVAVLMYYTPDYLHLSVTPDRRGRWEIKFRWRAIAAILILGLLLSHGNGGRLFTLFAVAVLAGVDWLARDRIPSRMLPAFYWASDLVLIFLALIGASAGAGAILMLLLAAAAHLAIVRGERLGSMGAIIAGSGVVAAGFATAGSSGSAFVAGALLFAVAVIGTAWLVRRARTQNALNVGAALQELIDFTGYSADQIRHLWATSNQQLAENWRQAKPQEHDPEQMAEWYRQNSELYLFAISAYNLEYKRIRSNMKVLRLARGATLDYGAGNGEILLELARRGQRAGYYDVEGVTMKFAQRRAVCQGLEIDFFHAKDALAAAASEHGFDTVFSFDVLEHLPDLPGELDFLSSLLNPGGLFVFDVPAGSTKAHPMHLNHNLDVLAFMRSKSLVDERDIMLRLPLRKEEKYVFRKPA